MLAVVDVLEVEDTGRAGVTGVVLGAGAALAEVATDRYAE